MTLELEKELEVVISQVLEFLPKENNGEENKSREGNVRECFDSLVLFVEGIGDQYVVTINNLFNNNVINEFKYVFKKVSFIRFTNANSEKDEKILFLLKKSSRVDLFKNLFMNRLYKKMKSETLLGGVVKNLVVGMLSYFRKFSDEIIEDELLEMTHLYDYHFLNLLLKKKGEKISSLSSLKTDNLKEYLDEKKGELTDKEKKSLLVEVKKKINKDEFCCLVKKVREIIKKLLSCLKEFGKDELDNLEKILENFDREVNKGVNSVVADNGDQKNSHVSCDFYDLIIKMVKFCNKGGKEDLKKVVNNSLNRKFSEKKAVGEKIACSVGKKAEEKYSCFIVKEEESSSNNSSINNSAFDKFKTSTTKSSKN